MKGVVPAEEGRGMVDHTGDRGRVLLLMWVAEGGGVGRLIFVEFHRVTELVELTGI